MGLFMVWKLVVNRDTIMPMIKTPYFKSWFAILVSIAVLHFVGLKLYLYWTTDWFDILLHFLGGAWVALGAFWFFFCSDFVRLDKKNKFLVIFGATLVVGILWEVFEYFFEITQMGEVYSFDTMLDLVMDLVGAVSVLIFTRSHTYLSPDKSVEQCAD